MQARVEETNHGMVLNTRGEVWLASGLASNNTLWVSVPALPPY